MNRFEEEQNPSFRNRFFLISRNKRGKVDAIDSSKRKDQVSPIGCRNVSFHQVYVYLDW